jgi:hypothetical protein
MPIGNRRGSITDCNYLYITDNLLDPSQVAWVHRSSFGNADSEDTPLQTRTADDGVSAARWMLDVEVQIHGPSGCTGERCAIPLAAQLHSALCG